MEAIILIAQQLSKEGKVPNTALIKARLPKNVPLPMIIQGLKSWKSDPNQLISNPTQPPTVTTKGDNFETLLATKIELAIAPLIAEIAYLKKEVAQLQLHLTTKDKN